jgi:hypothetical protein
MSWRAKFRRWRKRRTVGVVDTARDRFCVHFGRKSAAMLWRDVTRIDAGRQPTLIVEIFYVRFFSGSGRQLMVDDRMEGFSEFEAIAFEHWPEMKDRWLSIFLGLPDRAGQSTIWPSARKDH